MPPLEILGLEKTYTVGFWRKQPKHAMQPLHLTVEEGEIFGFLGPNGAGKTTTLKRLMGLGVPTSGPARPRGPEATDRRSCGGGGAGRHQRRAAPQVLEGHAAAGRNRAGHFAQSQAGVL